MRLADGPRPWPVRLFALILLGAALWSFLSQLGHALGEEDESNRIALVSVLSGQFFMVAIPVAFVWFFASRIAKWLVTVISIISAVWTLADTLRWPGFGAEHLPSLAFSLLMYSVVGLLFTPSARDWFAAKGRHDAKSFR